MEDTLAGELIDLMPIRCLEWRGAAHIKGLQEVAWMRRHTESDYPMVCVVPIKLRCSMAAMFI